MSRRPSFSRLRRRRMLKLQVADRLDNLLENRSTVTPIGTAAFGLAIVGAAAQPGSVHAMGGGMTV
jgi:hypothetical protein